MPIILFKNKEIIALAESISEEMLESELQAKIETLPKLWRERINAYSSPLDRQKRYLARDLLNQILLTFGKSPFDPETEIHFHSNGKQSLPENIPFSLAHSSKFAVCAVCINKSIGIDIEQIQPIDWKLHLSFLHPNEQIRLHQSETPEIDFFEFWTRKEALIKAIGHGIHLDLSSIDATKTRITYKSIPYEWIELPEFEKYKISMAIEVDP